MRTLKRDKRPLYLCKKIKDSEPQQFEKPLCLRLNTVATSSGASLQTFGENYREYRKATMDLDTLKEFHEGDRCYILVDKPSIHDPLCGDCDFIVHSVSDSISEGVVVFKRLQNGYR